MDQLKPWVIFLFLLTGCNRSDPWRNLSIKTGSPSFNSSKLVYPATYFLHDLELEFLYVEEELSAYINVYAETIPPYQGDEKLALLILEAGGKSQQFIVDRLAGGQRLKIPTMSLPSIITTLKKYRSITLQLDEIYKTKINTQDFKKHFEKLHVKPFAFISNNPIGLAL